MNKLARAIIPVFFCCFPIAIFAQYSNQQIDSLLNVAGPAYRKVGDFNKLLSTYQKILVAAKQNQYAKGIRYSYYYLGNVYRILSRHKQSILYLDTCMNLNKGLGDFQLESQVFAEFAQNYIELSYFYKTIQYCNKGLQSAANIKEDSLRVPVSAYLYGVLSNAYERIKKPDSSFVVSKAAYRLKRTPFFALKVAKLFLSYTVHIDSARIYLDEANRLWNTGKYPIHQKSLLLRIEGLYAFNTDSYEEAIENYKKSIEISHRLENITEEKATYRLLYEVYQTVGDEKGKREALEQYVLLNERVEAEMKISREMQVDKWLEEQQQNSSNRLRKSYLIILLLIVVASGLFFYLRHRTRLRLKVKDSQLEVHKLQHESLLKKVNESFDELLVMAKDNHAQFWTRFQEIYPLFAQRLLHVNPKLKSSELTFCAYIYLGFTTKEIAEYTFKAIKTIEGNRYNIRKRLSLSPDIDLAVWIKNTVA